jgi:DNA-binding NtrC family response regulator
VCTPRRILIVDDEDAILFAMRDYFTLRGYEVDSARDLDEAAARLDTHRYTVVVADLCLSEMPSAEGLEVAARVRSSSPGTAVILFTAYGSPEVEAEARRRGVCVVLKKPQPLTEVERWIRSVDGTCLHESGSASS